MTQNKYVVGKKYKINDDWNDHSNAVVTVVRTSFDGGETQILIQYEDGETAGFETGSYIDSVTTPYEEEKTIVTEKVTRVIEAGEYGHVWVDNFEIGVDKHITIEVNSNVFTKQTLGDLIKTLNEIHEVM